MIADMPSNKNRQQTVPELFVRSRKINISLDFITQYYFTVPKNTKLHFALKIDNEQLINK